MGGKKGESNGGVGGEMNETPSSGGGGQQNSLPMSWETKKKKYRK